MEKIKPWQIILMVVAVGVLCFTVWSAMSSGAIPKTSGYMTVDIMTGQLFDVRKGKAKGVPLPAKHPDTGDRTLYPVNQIDGLSWKIPDGYNSFLTENVRKGSVLKKGEFKVEVLPDDAIVFKIR